MTSTPDTALLLIDVQQSFTARTYWDADRAKPFLEHCNALIDGCLQRRTPIVRIFHTDGPNRADNPFSPSSGLIRPLQGLKDFQATCEIEKHRHSALVGTILPVWLRENRISRLIIAGIRTEQCCETTTRHASDEGWQVDYCAEATLTFDMTTPDGQSLAANDIVERTATVLSGRFATLVNVEQALKRAQVAGRN